jgi:hypothetical protein
MKRNTIDSLKRGFDRHPILSSGAPDTQLWDSELARLDLTPADDYIEFIRLFGGSIVGSYTIVGVGASPAMGAEESSVVELTRTFRADGWPGTEQWIVFSNDLAGNPIGMDRHGVIWTWDHDSGQTMQLADSFESFLTEHCLASEERPAGTHEEETDTNWEPESRE